MPESALVESDEVWAKYGDKQLLVRLYRRIDLPDPLPPLVCVHGGGWNLFDRTAGALYQRALALAGFLVAAIDFRQGPDFQHPAASADVTAAVRWLRANAARLRIDPRHIGLLGSSSGGHLAMLAGVLPDIGFHAGTPIWVGERFAVRDDISANVDYLVALWPVSDPFQRYRYAKRAGIEKLQQLHERFFEDEDAMRAASVPRVLNAGEAQQIPPLLVVMPGEDGNVPMEITFDLIRAWQGRGGYLEYAHFPGQPHGFGYTQSAASEQMQTLIIDFCRRMLAR